YSNYASGVLGGGTAPSPTEVGIIDRMTHAKKVLNLDPTKSKLGYVSIFPQWSPDDRKIVYCSGIISTEPLGFVGGFNLCILKQLE
ncbi:MAG: hypothetical protein ABJA67_03230, partial [Chthonomonadales bacterium]